MFYGAAGRMVPSSEVTEAVAEVYKSQVDAQAKEWMLPMRCLCMKKAVSPAFSEFLLHLISYRNFFSL